MSVSLSAELAATCNSLGYFDSKAKKYYADSNTLETVKDLIRYLRRDDDTHEIRRYLGKSQVLQTDLLPLLKSYWQQQDLFDVVLRLIVNLTSPALILWKEHVPTEPTPRYHFMQIEDHQQKYKQTFADESIWAILSTKISKILETDFGERGEENNLIIERVLILIRNILYIPANPDEERRPDNDASIHDQVLWSLHQSGMLDIILFIASSTNEQAYYLHIIEILSFMLREQPATELANTALERSQTEKMRDEAELLLMRHRENSSKQQKIKKFCGARHSRFGGTYVMKSISGISDKEYIYHKPLNNIDSIHFDLEKKKARTPKNRLPLEDVSIERRSAFSVKLILKEFCTEFLTAAYNTFMYHVNDNITRSKSQGQDESYYLWALRFFMEFNRGYNFQVKLVSETISVQTFYFVHRQIESYYDYIVLVKKECKPWSRRLHLALLAYRELLLTICDMDKSKDEGVRKSAKVIKSTIFYVMEYREVIVMLLISFDETLFSFSYLNDLLETQHVFLKMLEVYCKNENDIVVQGIKKKKNKRKTKKNKKITPNMEDTEPNLDETWNDAAPQLSVLLGSNDNLPTIVPFDATLDTPIDEQKSVAMKNIQHYLRESEFENALGLLRASREVWPENDSFGSSTMAPEDELLVLRDIFFADFGNRKKETIALEHDIEEDEYNEEDEEMDEMSEPSEANFKFSDFLKRFANQKVLRACSLALKNFERNSVYTNYCIVKLLHRIALDLNMFTMLFQVSIFMTFQKIFSLQDLPQYKGLVKFATYILRQFFKVADKNRKVFMEALFWKSPKEACEIEEGYGSYHEKSKAESRHWTEAEENELTHLFNEHQEKGIEEDVVDWIVANLVDHMKTRKAVLKKLKSMSLLTNYKKVNPKTTRSNVWTEEEEQNLRDLYENFKNENNPVELIANGLLTKRPYTKIAQKLIEMGLIQSRNEVMKKRLKSKKFRNDKGSDQSQSSDSENSSCDDDDREVDASSNKTLKAKPKNKTANKKSRSKSRPQTKRPIPVRIPRADIIKLLLKVANMSDAIDWLRESLSDIIDDRKEGNDEEENEIPLVAIMDYSITAMENSDFQELLLGFQIRQPADEQEIHWRVPNHLSIPILEEYCQLLTDALENKLSAPVDEKTINENDNSNFSDDDDDKNGPSTSSQRSNLTVNHRSPNHETSTAIDENSNSGDEDLFIRLKRITESNRNNDSNTNSQLNNLTVVLPVKDSAESDSDSDTDINRSSLTEYPKPAVKKRAVLDSDDDQDKENQPERQIVIHKRNFVDSESENEREVIETIDSDKDDHKRAREVSDTDSPLKKKKRSRIISSDDDSS